MNDLADWIDPLRNMLGQPAQVEHNKEQTKMRRTWIDPDGRVKTLPSLNIVPKGGTVSGEDEEEVTDAARHHDAESVRAALREKTALLAEQDTDRVDKVEAIKRKNARAAVRRINPALAEEQRKLLEEERRLKRLEANDKKAMQTKGFRERRRIMRRAFNIRRLARKYNDNPIIMSNGIERKQFISPQVAFYYFGLGIMLVPVFCWRLEYDNEYSFQLADETFTIERIIRPWPTMNWKEWKESDRKLKIERRWVKAERERMRLKSPVEPDKF